MRAAVFAHEGSVLGAARVLCASGEGCRPVGLFPIRAGHLGRRVACLVVAMPHLILVHVVDAAGIVRMKGEPAAMMIAAMFAATIAAMMTAMMTAVSAVCACQLRAHESDHDRSCKNQ
jgi:hypothetical protein